MYSKKGVVLYLFYLLHFWSQFDSSKLTVIVYVSSTVAYGGIRWHTARQKIIFKHVQKFVRIGRVLYTISRVQNSGRLPATAGIFRTPTGDF